MIVDKATRRARTCIVHEAIQAVVLLLEAGSEGANGVKALQVQNLGNNIGRRHLLLDGGNGRLQALDAAPCHHDVGALLGQLEGRLIANAGIGARDDVRATRQRLVEQRRGDHAAREVVANLQGRRSALPRNRSEHNQSGLLFAARSMGALHVT